MAYVHSLFIKYSNAEELEYFAMGFIRVFGWGLYISEPVMWVLMKDVTDIRTNRSKLWQLWQK